jgi:signal transduction protein with GAF and PtsI domain
MNTFNESQIDLVIKRLYANLFQAIADLKEMNDQMKVDQKKSDLYWFEAYDLLFEKQQQIEKLEEKIARARAFKAKHIKPHIINKYIHIRK